MRRTMFVYPRMGAGPSGALYWLFWNGQAPSNLERMQPMAIFTAVVRGKGAIQVRELIRSAVVGATMLEETRLPCCSCQSIYYHCWKSV